MSEPIVVTGENFQQAVLESQVPVLIDFWADWCEPCKMLAPVLDKLAAEFTDRLVVAKINVDEENQLAAAAGIRSLPTLLLLVNGQPVEQIVGVQPEQTIRAVIEKFVDEQASSESAPPAIDPGAEGDPDVAIAKLEALLQEDPGNLEAIATIAKIRIGNGQLEEARALIADIDAEAKDKPPMSQVSAALYFADASSSAAAALPAMPTDIEAVAPEALRDTAISLVSKGQHDGAAELLLGLMSKDRKFDDDIGRKTLLQLCELLGPEDPRVGQLRRRMMTLIY